MTFWGYNKLKSKLLIVLSVSELGIYTLCGKSQSSKINYQKILLQHWLTVVVVLFLSYWYCFAATFALNSSVSGKKRIQRSLQHNIYVDVPNLTFNLILSFYITVGSICYSMFSDDRSWKMLRKRISDEILCNVMISTRFFVMS